MRTTSLARRGRRFLAVPASVLGLVVLSEGTAFAANPQQTVYVKETVTCPSGQSKLAYATGNTLKFSDWIATTNVSSTTTVFTFAVYVIADQTAAFTRRCYNSYAPYAIRHEWSGNVNVTYNPPGKIYTVP